MPKLYTLKLTGEERAELEGLVSDGMVAGWKIQRANALLTCDQSAGAPAWPDGRIAEAFGCTARSLESWRKQAVERGPLSLLERKPRAVTPESLLLDGAKEARLTALCRSTPPTGYARWSLRLLADRLVGLEVVDAISHETVRPRVEKKRLEAVAEVDVVHSAGAGRGVRVPRWNKCWRCTNGRRIRGSRWCAWTSRPSS